MTNNIPTTEDITRYGADAADWLKRWDAGEIVWTIEMGGMGPGYEQAIQVTVAEVVRYLVEIKIDFATLDDDAREILSGEIDKALWANKVINDLGLSGAQAGAAKSLAVAICRDSPAGVMTDERVKDRHIMVSRNFPRAA